MKSLIVAFFACLLFGCTAMDQQQYKRQVSGEGDYMIVMYSGGAVVFKDSFHGVVNNSEHSDGCYYFKGDTLVEVSGDYVIKSIK